MKLKINLKTITIPVFCHNLKNYDAHLIMREIGKVQGERELKFIPNNMEKYITFSWGKLRFVDSCQHLSAALERLVDGGRGEVGVWCSNTGKYLGRAHKGYDTKTLKKEYKKGECIVCGKELKNEGFEITRARYEDEEVQDLVLQKGVYPYEYMDSWGRFNGAELPPKKEFYSTLKRKHISDEDYAHAQRVWNGLKDKNMGAYHDLYLEMDMLLLADVLMRYRRNGFSKYGLDPAHYLTTPGYSWDALLKMTKIKLELLTDYDMHMFIEQGMRGGISTVGGKRFARANNPQLGDYDPSQAFSYIMYLEANNLYGWAMSQYLPVGDFR